MTKRYFYFFLCGLSGLMGIGPFATAQIGVNGSACAIAGGGRGVMYTVSGQVQPTDQLTWQITGGVIAGTGVATLSGAVSKIGSQVRVVWTTNAKTGSIRVTDDRLGTNSLAVTVVSISTGITPASQAIQPDSTLSITGGGPDMSCPAVYAYWWEAADSAGGPFVPVSGYTGQHLSVDSVRKKAYYRRVICLNGENSYSNVVFIDVATTKPL